MLVEDDDYWIVFWIDVFQLDTEDMLVRLLFMSSDYYYYKEVWILYDSDINVKENTNKLEIDLSGDTWWSGLCLFDKNLVSTIIHEDQMIMFSLDKSDLSYLTEGYKILDEESIYLYTKVCLENSFFMIFTDGMCESDLSWSDECIENL